MINRHGLSRTIPAHIKRQVRQRCGFGCIICGTAIVHYEHVSPEFVSAKTHDSAGIVLLCPTCHDKKTRNFLSKRRVLDAMTQPAAKAAGFAFSELEDQHSHPNIVLGGTKLTNCPTPVMVRGVPLISIERAEIHRGPYQLSASFFDQAGNPSLLIRRNEWQVGAQSWDVQATGGRIIVRTGPRQIALQLLLDPGNGVVVERLNMHCLGYQFIGNDRQLEVISSNGNRLSMAGCLIDNCQVGLALG